MRLSNLRSTEVATLYGPNDPNGWKFWFYRELVADFNGDGVTEVAYIGLTMVENGVAAPVADPRTFLKVVSLTATTAQDVTAQYLPAGSIEGWARRTYTIDLNDDGFLDFVFMMNREDGRHMASSGPMTRGHENAILISNNDGYEVRGFSGDYWTHMGAIGDFDADCNVDLIEGYFMDQDRVGGTLIWEFDKTLGNFVQQSTLTGV